jgi:F-type H+-transporting ATPase subunit b
MTISEIFRNATQKKQVLSVSIITALGLMAIQTSAVFAASGGEGGGGGGITVIPDASVVIQIINFLFLIWVLNLIIYKPIRNILIQRKEKFSGLRADIETAESEAAEQDQAFASGIKEARARGLKQKEALLQTASDEEKEIIGKINEKAQAELTKVREQIAREADGARETLMKEVESCAGTISEKILGRAV